MFIDDWFNYSPISGQPEETCSSCRLMFHYLLIVLNKLQLLFFVARIKVASGQSFQAKEQTNAHSNFKIIAIIKNI